MAEPERLIQGVYDAEEFADAVDELRTKGLPPGLATGWKDLDEFYSVPRRKWTIVTGYSGSGKSTWVDNLMVNLAKKHKWKFLVCSPENQPIEEHIAALQEIYSGKKFGNPKLSDLPERYFMDDEQYTQSFLFVNNYFNFINPPEVEFNIKDIISLAQMVKEHQFDFDGFVIDPYNELEHKRPSAMMVDEYVSWVISLFRRFINDNNLHGWFVAHPTKPQQVTMKYDKGVTEEELVKKVYKRATLHDISGAEHWNSKSDFGVIVHRDMKDSTAPSIVEVAKVRKRNQGKKGEVPMFYDYYCNRYVERYSELLTGRI